MTNGKPQTGFTLLELLVVIIVITLLPGLDHARGQTRMGQCLSNNRQIILAEMIYRTDNGGQNYYGTVEPLPGTTNLYCDDVDREASGPSIPISEIVWNLDQARQHGALVTEGYLFWL